MVWWSRIDYCVSCCAWNKSINTDHWLRTTCLYISRGTVMIWVTKVCRRQSYMKYNFIWMIHCHVLRYHNIFIMSVYLITYRLFDKDWNSCHNPLRRACDALSQTTSETWYTLIHAQQNHYQWAVVRCSPR